MTRPEADDDRGNHLDARARGHARVYGAGQNMSIDRSRHSADSGYRFGTGNSFGPHNNFGRQHIGEQHIGDRYEVDLNPVSALFTGRGPGRVLMVLGLCVSAFCFAGWMSIVFGGMSGDIDSPRDALGTRLGSGIPVGAVYFFGFGFGGMLLGIGNSMAKAAVKGGSRTGHLIATVIVCAGGLLCVVYALGGSPPSTLLPFSGTPEVDVPTGVVSDTRTSAKRDGLTLTVTRIENVDGHGVVHLHVRNNTGHTISLPLQAFVVTDGAGHAYQPRPFGGDWNPQIGASARQSGTIDLQEPVERGTGDLRVEFTMVIGESAPKGIAVTGIPSRE
jgi:hypothetical protein